MPLECIFFFCVKIQIYKSYKHILILKHAAAIKWSVNERLNSHSHLSSSEFVWQQLYNY